MRNKDYRELQLSSSQLVLIFLAILVIGVVVFILGVSVGKKQTQLAGKTRLSSQTIAKKITRPETPPSQEEKKPESKQEEKKSEQPASTIKKELESHKKTQQEPVKKQETKKETLKKSTPPGQQGRYYIQIGAYSTIENANTVAKLFKDRGYPSGVHNPLPSARKKLYRVRIGSYQTREQAERILEELKRSKIQAQTDYFIVTL